MVLKLKDGYFLNLSRPKNFCPFACFPSEGLNFSLSILRGVQKEPEMLRLKLHFLIFRLNFAKNLFQGKT